MSKVRDDDCTQLTLKRKVAIIGASYAGLTLANYLKKHSIPFVIFESSPSYYLNDDDDDDVDDNYKNDDGIVSTTEVQEKLKPNLFVIGPFILPSFRRIVDELGIQIPINAFLDDSSNGSRKDDIQNIENCYERSDVILYLLQNVKEEIQFNTSIESITCIKKTCTESSSYFCNTTTMNGTSKKFGPVEYIIAADGVHSIVGSKYKFDDDRILLIGDARWVNDSWYNFGFQRVREGADVAMNDGLELGKILKSLIGEYDNAGKERKFDDNEMKSNEVVNRIKKFSAYEKYKLRMRKGILRRFLFVVFVAYIIGKFLKGSQFMKEQNI